MARKEYKQENFTFKTLNTGDITIYCLTYETSKNWGHMATLYTENNNEIKVKIVYYNRTWERFKYESILYKMLEKIYPLKSQELERSFIKQQIESIANHKTEECENWVNTFLQVWNETPKSIKEKIQNDNITIETETQADDLIMALQMALQVSKLLNN